MKAFLTGLIFYASMAISCDGGMPYAQKLIPEFSLGSNEMTEEQFKKTIKTFEDFFTPHIDQMERRELVIFSSWKSNTVNAFAEQKERKVMITVYGGLARHPAITADGLSAVLCHELGHHFGGFPKKQTNRWSSAEGQSDYYASMKCLRRLWENENNTEAMSGIDVPQVVKLECAQTFPDHKAQALCQRMSLAGRSVALMIQDLDHDSLEPKFETPEQEHVRVTNYSYPFAQCRLDTFFQGAVCPVSEREEFDDKDQVIGACHEKLGDSRGLRPRCWFIPRI